MIADPNHPALAKLKALGYRFRIGKIAGGHGGAAAFQKSMSRVETEMIVRSPSGIEAQIDLLMADPHVPGRVVFGEAKAIFVEDVGKSAHLIFYGEKAKQLSKQLAVALESKGLARTRSYATRPAAPSGAFPRRRRDVCQHRRTAAVAHAEEELPGPSPRVPAIYDRPADKTVAAGGVDKIVDDYVSISVVDWGRLKKK